MTTYKPHGIPQWPRPPRALFFLHCTSFFVSVIMFIISFLEFGASTIFINLLLSLFVMIFHGTILLLAYRRPPSNEPTFSPATTKVSIGFGCFFALGWAIAFAFGILSIRIRANTTPSLESIIISGIPNAVLQMFLDLIAIALMVSIVVVAMRRRWEQQAALELYEGDWYAL